MEDQVPFESKTPLRTSSSSSSAISSGFGGKGNCQRPVRGEDWFEDHRSLIVEIGRKVTLPVFPKRLPLSLSLSLSSATKEKTQEE